MPCGGRLGASWGLSPDPGRTPGGEHSALHAGSRGGASCCPQPSARTPKERLRSHRPLTTKRGLAGTGGRGGGIAEPQPGQPGAGGRAASASHPVRSSAPSVSRSPTLPLSLLALSHLHCSSLRSEPPPRGARCAAAAPRPPASSSPPNPPATPPRSPRPPRKQRRDAARLRAPGLAGPSRWAISPLRLQGRRRRASPHPKSYQRARAR